MWAFRNNNLSISLWFIMLVVTVLLPLTHGEYHFVGGHQQFSAHPLYLKSKTLIYVEETNNSTNNSTAALKNSSKSKTRTVTIVYEDNEIPMENLLFSFYASLASGIGAFCLVVIYTVWCDQRIANINRAPPIPPLSPSPSYSQFAPPNYGSVMKMQHARSNSDIFVIPVSDETNAAKDDDVSASTNTNENNTTATSQPLTPSIS